MLVGERLKAIREAKHLSQGDVEKRTGRLRMYVSRVENGQTIPSIESFEKFARAREVPLYQLFYEGKEPPKLPQTQPGEKLTFGSRWKKDREFERFRRLLSRMTPQERAVLLAIASKMAMLAKH